MNKASFIVVFIILGVFFSSLVCCYGCYHTYKKIRQQKVLNYKKIFSLFAFKNQINLINNENDKKSLSDNYDLEVLDADLECIYDVYEEPIIDFFVSYANVYSILTNEEKEYYKFFNSIYNNRQHSIIISENISTYDTSVDNNYETIIEVNLKENYNEKLNQIIEEIFDESNEIEEESQLIINNNIEFINENENDRNIIYNCVIDIENEIINNINLNNNKKKEIIDNDLIIENIEYYNETEIENNEFNEEIIVNYPNILDIKFDQFQESQSNIENQNKFTESILEKVLFESEFENQKPNRNKFNEKTFEKVIFDSEFEKQLSLNDNFTEETLEKIIFQTEFEEQIYFKNDNNFTENQFEKITFETEFNNKFTKEMEIIEENEEISIQSVITKNRINPYIMKHDSLHDNLKDIIKTKNIHNNIYYPLNNDILMNINNDYDIDDSDDEISLYSRISNISKKSNGRKYLQNSSQKSFHTFSSKNKIIPNNNTSNNNINSNVLNNLLYFPTITVLLSWPEPLREKN